MRMARGEASAFWREKMGLFESSGISAKEFCQREGLSLPYFYQWRRKFAKEAEKRNGGEFRADGQRSTPKFLPLSITHDSKAAIEVVLACGATIRVHRGVDFGLLQSVVACLSGGASC